MNHLATTTAAAVRSFFTFRLGKRLHGIEVLHVREISPLLPMTPVPQSPPAVRGLVNLRSDGHKVLLAQKLERPRAATHEEFDVHLLEPDASGELRYLPKH